MGVVVFMVVGLRPFLREMMDDDGDIRIGPIPKGTPVNLLFNIDIDVDLKDTERLKKLVALFIKLRKGLVEIKQHKLSGDAAAKRLRELVPDLRAVSTCPDFVTDRGHYFGRNLSDEDKRALIEFVKFF